MPRKPKHGGRRKGSGRKPTRVVLALPTALLPYLRSYMDRHILTGNRAECVLSILEAEIVPESDWIEYAAAKRP